MKHLALALTTGILIVVLGACGSSSTGTGASSSAGAAGTGSRQQARLALAQCLRAHGLNVPDPGAGGGPGGGLFRALQNVPTARLQSARQACKGQLAAAFPQLNLSPAQQAQFRMQLVKFAECMRSHGINIPDPQVGSGPGGFGFRRAFGSVDRNSPAFQSALTACRPLRPRFGGGGPGGGPGG